MTQAWAKVIQFDYTSGKLDQLIDVIIESGAKLFVSAVGVPPSRVIQKLHMAGVLYAVCGESHRMLNDRADIRLTEHRRTPKGILQ